MILFFVIHLEGENSIYLKTSISQEFGLTCLGLVQLGALTIQAILDIQSQLDWPADTTP